jgi:hypothetical protein
MPLSELSRVLTRAKYAIINSVSGKPVAVTSRDILTFMQTGEPAGPPAQNADANEMQAKIDELKA